MDERHAKDIEALEKNFAEVCEQIKEISKPNPLYIADGNDADED